MDGLSKDSPRHTLTLLIVSIIRIRAINKCIGYLMMWMGARLFGQYSTNRKIEQQI